MRKTLYLYGFLSVSFLFSKTFESSKNLVNYDIYQDSIQVKSPVSAVVSGTDIEVFDYDNFGNLTKDKDKSYVYNDFGQISRIKFNDGKVLDLYYDDFGRLSNFGSASFDYNDFNMMSSFKDSAVNAEYFYDDKTGYRSSKIVNGIEYTFDLDDRGRLLRQTDSLGNVTEIVWNGELPETLTFNGKIYNFICNDHGDVTNLVLKDGELVNSYEYDIYGKVLSDVESVPNPIRYAHEYYDSESKLYYLRGRYYNPDTKSFTTADPAEADAKLYAYTGYNPINFIDPSGYALTEKKDKYGRTVLTISGDDLKTFIKHLPDEDENVELAGKLTALAGVAMAVTPVNPAIAAGYAVYGLYMAFGFNKPKGYQEAIKDLQDMMIDAYKANDTVKVIFSPNGETLIAEKHHKDKSGSLTIAVKTF